MSIKPWKPDPYYKIRTAAEVREAAARLADRMARRSEVASLHEVARRIRRIPLAILVKR